MSGGDEHYTPRPNSNQQSAKREPKHWLEYAIFIFVVLTAIFTGAAAWYTRQQWQTSQDTLVFSERAFVHFPINFGTVMVKSPDTGKYALAIRVNLANSGNTRTTALRFLIKCAPSATKLVEPWGLLHQGTEEHLPQVIGPKSSIPAVCSFPQADVESMSRGTLFGYLLADVDYRDIFNPGIRHITQLDTVVTITSYAAKGEGFDSQETIQPIGQHNCADEDCPTN